MNLIVHEMMFHQDNDPEITQARLLDYYYLLNSIENELQVLKLQVHCVLWFCQDKCTKIESQCCKLQATFCWRCLETGGMVEAAMTSCVEETFLTFQVGIPDMEM